MLILCEALTATTHREIRNAVSRILMAQSGPSANGRAVTALRPCRTLEVAAHPPQVNRLPAPIGIHSSLDVAPDGRGLAYVPLDQVRHQLDHGDLAHVLIEFAPDLPGYHLCYPSRRHASTAFGLLADTPRYRIWLFLGSGVMTGTG